MTNQLDETLAALREEFAAATFPEGGLLLHLSSGDLFPLDDVGAAVWDAIDRSGDGPAASAAVAATLRVPAKAAEAELARVLAQAHTLRGRRPAIPPAFHEGDDALTLQEGERTLLSLDKRSLTLTAADLLRERSDEEMAATFRVFVPKVYGRWFPLAMHASAVTIRDRSILFCGESGAGKTTTARTLVEEIAGSSVFSEDVVVLAEQDGILTMVEGAEAAIQAWMAEATAALVERRQPSHEALSLKEALMSARGRVPIHKVIFLRAERRQGTAWSLQRLSRSRSLMQLFLHSFLHSPEAGALRQHLRTCHALASQIDAAEALMVPAGLASLRSGSRSQIATIAS